MAYMDPGGVEFGEYMYIYIYLWVFPKIGVRGTPKMDGL